MSRTHSSRSKSDVSRKIIERIIANKDGKVSDTDMRHLSDDEGADVAGDTEIDRNEAFMLGRSDQLDTDIVPNNVYTLVPANQRNEFRMKFKTSIGGQIEKKLTNSDLIYFNQLLYEMNHKVYTTQI